MDKILGRQSKTRKMGQKNRLSEIIDRCEQQVLVDLYGNGNYAIERSLHLKPYFEYDYGKATALDTYSPLSDNILICFSEIVFHWDRFCIACLNAAKENDLQSKQNLAFASLAQYLQEMLLGLHQNALSSSATPAFALARSLSEAVEIWLLLEGNEKAAAEYVEWEEGFYVFWRKHISRDKHAETVKVSMKRWLPQSTLAGLNEIWAWVTNERDLFSQAVHPSFRAGVMASSEYDGTFSSPYASIWPPARAYRYAGIMLTSALHLRLENQTEDNELSRVARESELRIAACTKVINESFLKMISNHRIWKRTRTSAKDKQA